MIDRLGQLTWPQLQERRPTVLLPLGSCEQHGPHLPLLTDLLVAQAVAERAAALAAGAADLVLAPGQPYGASGEHEGFPGTVSIGHTAVGLLLLELGRSISRWADRMVVVNGHGGNLAAVAGAVCRLRYEGRDVAWWACAPPGGDAHAGRTETSIMNALAPASVRAEQAEPGVSEPIERLMDRLVAESVRGVSPNGVLGDPSGANAAEGEGLLAGMAERLAADLSAWRVDERGRLAAAPVNEARP